MIWDDGETDEEDDEEDEEENRHGLTFLEGGVQFLFFFAKFLLHIFKLFFGFSLHFLEDRVEILFHFVLQLVVLAEKFPLIPI